MARRKVEEKNYPELIEAAEERITSLSAELKQEKANLKQLKKDQIRYEAMVEKQQKTPYTHAQIKDIFSLNRQVSLSDL